MITGAQIKAARALAGWSQEDLADHAGVGIVTIKRFETSVEIGGTIATMRKIIGAFESAGIRFIEAGLDGGPGVRLAK